MERALPEIVVTELDYDRLSDLIAPLRGTSPVADQLAGELERAEVVEADDVPPDVVTMNSRVEMEDVDTGERREVTLVYPGAADFDHGRLSILAPVGAALLGLRVGQQIDWPRPGGTLKRLKVIAVTWQPEAAGHRSL